MKPGHKNQEQPFSRQHLLLWLPLLLFALLLAGCGQTAEAAELAAASNVEGAVEWQSSANAEWSSLEDGAELAPGAVVRTAADGRTWLTFPDESRVYLAPDSEIQIIQILLAEEADGRTVRLEQNHGQARYIVREAASPVAYTITAPHGQAVSENGVFTMSADDARQTRLSVSSGLVEGTSAGGTYPVSAGRMVMLRSDQQPAMASFVVFGQGRVTQTGEVWSIGGRHFVVGDGTVVRGIITPDSYAYVEGHIQEDGTLVADLISLQDDGDDLIIPGDDGDGLFDGFQDEAGECVAATGTVTAFDGTLVTFSDGGTLSLADVENVEGMIEPYSVLLVVTCTDEGGLARTRVFVLDSPADGDLNGNRVTLCHVPPGNPNSRQTITVGEASVNAHLAHGDYVGLCNIALDDDVDDDDVDDDDFDDDVDQAQVIVCHIPPGNPDNRLSIRIGEPALEAHLAHGDTIGLCEGDTEDDIVDDDDFDDEDDFDDDDFDDEDDFDDDDDNAAQVTLCHVPSGNPANQHTITIGESAVDAHLGHGDYLGVCTGEGSSENGNNGNNKNKDKDNRGNGKNK